MKIVLNGQEREIEPATSLAQLLEIAGFAGRRVAVEINQAIVPRSQYPQCQLDAGDHIEIVHAIGGG